MLCRPTCGGPSVFEWRIFVRLPFRDFVVSDPRGRGVYTGRIKYARSRSRDLLRSRGLGPGTSIPRRGFEAGEDHTGEKLGSVAFQGAHRELDCFHFVFGDDWSGQFGFQRATDLTFPTSSLVQHNRLPGAPLYYYATLGAMSIIAVAFALLAIFPLDMLHDHPEQRYIKLFMVPVGITAAFTSALFMGAIEGACDRAGNVLSKVRFLRDQIEFLSDHRNRQIPAHAIFHIGFSYSSYILIQFIALLHDHVSVPPHTKSHKPATHVLLIPYQPSESWLMKIERIAYDLLFLLRIKDVEVVRLEEEGGRSPLMGERGSLSMDVPSLASAVSE